MREGTAYIDHINGRWEAWHNAEGRSWPLGYYVGKIDAVEYLRRRGFAKIVDCTSKANDGSHIIR